MLKKSGILFWTMFPLLAFSQSETLNLKNHHGGLFSLGTRTTISTFNHGSWQGTSVGVGGQFRIQLHDKINTEWFADYMTSEIGTSGNRQDVHVGWSVMYYPLKDKTYKKLMKPYLVMGHCFDYTRVTENTNLDNSAERWSSAIQCGVGNHFNITERFDLTLVAQYMFHLGGHTEAHDNEGVFVIHEHEGFNLEGHLLFTIGINYKIADLW